MIYAVIMAGGRGTRFWPLSRKVRAKQFLDIIGSKSLLEHTLDRIDPIVDRDNILIVGSAIQKEFLVQHSPDIPERNLMFEPAGRNTAPCIGWAAMEAIKRDPNAIMVVLPADHMIHQADAFQANIRQAIDVVKHDDVLVTIGINPTFPHTGYGYIESESFHSFPTKVTAFHEKPDHQTAARYLESGRYFWNSGMFVWRAETILNLIKSLMPEAYALLEKISVSESESELHGLYTQLPSVSVDYGILENAVDRIRLIGADFTWSDIGNWRALEEFWDKDTQENACKGNVLAIDSTNNIVYSQDRLVSLVDVHDLIVVDTDDALMVIPKDSDQKIRSLYDKLDEEFK